MWTHRSQSLQTGIYNYLPALAATFANIIYYVTDTRGKNLFFHSTCPWLLILPLIRSSDTCYVFFLAYWNIVTVAEFTQHTKNIHLESSRDTEHILLQCTMDYTSPLVKAWQAHSGQPLLHLSNRRRLVIFPLSFYFKLISGIQGLCWKLANKGVQERGFTKIGADCSMRKTGLTHLMLCRHFGIFWATEKAQGQITAES